jgi:hypothetical protein
MRYAIVSAFGTLVQTPTAISARLDILEFAALELKYADNFARSEFIRPLFDGYMAIVLLAPASALTRIYSFRSFLNYREPQK